jgi:nucleotide-binding universal stress UspA family protein
VSIKSLLAPLFESADDDERAILNAVEFATPFGAHVTALFSGGHLSELVSVEPPVSRRFKPQLQIEARTLLAELTQAARSSFDTVVREHGLTLAETPGPQAGPTVSFEVRRGPIEATIQEAAVEHDVVVFYRGDGSEGEAPRGFSTMKSALQDCGRPLLVLPQTLPRPFASTVAIAWNGSIQGAHAVSAALPILTRARSVHILAVATEKSAAEQALKLRSYLGWHGIPSEVHTAERTADPVGATLLSMAEVNKADLLVLGGYTHSRIRENILGGVTHHVLRHARMPVFLSQ